MQINFVIGTGRCGTKSLSYILNNQNKGRCVHEGHPNLPYVVDVQLFVDKMTNNYDKYKNNYKYLTFDGFYYCWYLDEILEMFPDTRICCLIRDKSEVVESYFNKVTKRCPDGHFAHKNFWDNTDRARSYSDFDLCYPNYPKQKTLKDYISLYYDDYYNIVNDFIRQYPKNIRLFHIDTLNKESKLKKLFNYMKINKVDQRVPVSKIQVCHRWYEVKGDSKVEFKK